MDPVFERSDPIFIQDSDPDQGYINTDPHTCDFNET